MKTKTRPFTALRGGFTGNFPSPFPKLGGDSGVGTTGVQGNSLEREGVRTPATLGEQGTLADVAGGGHISGGGLDEDKKEAALAALRCGQEHFAKYEFEQASRPDADIC
jgi:hypothetical protein